jgi:hypothetical protein
MVHMHFKFSIETIVPLNTGVLKMFVDAQFPAGDVARLFDSWIDCSGYEYCTKKKTIGSKRDRG